MRRPVLALAILPLAAFAIAAPACGEDAAAAPPQAIASETGTMTLTIFLKHDESQTLGEINDRLRRQRFYESFPPKGVEVLSWNVVMGIGQVVTLRFPADRLREVNRAIENTAWGGYRTEFYPTYDYRPTAAKEREGMPSAFQ